MPIQQLPHEEWRIGSRLLTLVKKLDDRMMEMEKNLPHQHYLNENPNADLPDVQVQYWEDDDILDVHTGDTTGESETVASDIYIFRNKDNEVSGFCIIGAVSVLRYGGTTTVIIEISAGHKTPFEDQAEIHVEYLESSDLPQIHTGNMAGTCITIANGMDVYQDEWGMSLVSA